LGYDGLAQKICYDRWMEIERSVTKYEKALRRTNREWRDHAKAVHQSREDDNLPDVGGGDPECPRRSRRIKGSR
jgi:hypothetical protein